jgi:hypothetical protein
MQIKDSKPIPWQLQVVPFGIACVILSFLYNISSVENGLLAIARSTSIHNPIQGAQEYYWIENHAELPYELVICFALVFITIFLWWRIRPPHFNRTGVLVSLITVLFIISYIIFNTIGGMTLAYASNGGISSNQTASYSQFQVSNCNYMIFNDTQYVYAMPCTTGWGGAGSYGGPNAVGGVSGSSFSAIFSAVESSLPNGGNIAIDEGEYTAQAGIQITTSALNVYGTNYERR